MLLFCTSLSHHFWVFLFYHLYISYLSFYLFSFRKFTKVSFLGRSLQDVIRKYFVLVITPFVAAIVIKFDFSLLFQNNINLFAFITSGLFLISTFLVWKKYNTSRHNFIKINFKTYRKVFIKLLLTQILFVGLPEEFFFRFFLTTLLSSFGREIAILIPAIVFGVSHIYFLKKRLNLKLAFSQSVLYHTSIGIFLGVLWFYFQSFYFQVLFHALYNSVMLAYPETLKRIALQYKKKQLRKNINCEFV